MLSETSRPASLGKLLHLISLIRLIIGTNWLSGRKANGKWQTEGLAAAVCQGTMGYAEMADLRSADPLKVNPLGPCMSYITIRNTQSEKRLISDLQTLCVPVQSK